MIIVIDAKNLQLTVVELMYGCSLHVWFDWLAICFALQKILNYFVE